MPLDPVTGTLITTGISAAASGFNTAMQGNLNKKNRKFALQQYQRQREDELEFWRMNNAYNHPTAQMERIRSSGLNPHLVYGNGSVVGNTSSAPSAPTQAKWEGQAPQIDPSFAAQGLDQYFNLEAKKAQTDNLRAQNTLLQKEATLKTLGILKDAFDLDVDYETRDSIINKIVGEGMQSLNKNEGLLWDNAFKEETILDRIKLEKLGVDVKSATANYINVNTGNKAIDTEIKKVHKMLWDQGISPNDVMWVRLLSELLNNLGLSIK